MTKKTVKKDDSKLTRAEILKKVMADVNTKFKKNVIQFAVDEEIKERIPFGVEDIDNLTGGGTLCGNFSIIYGGESVGKSTLALIQIAKAQELGKTCAYIDLEHSFDIIRAKILGVDLSTLLLIEDIDNAEEAMDIVIKLAKEKVVDLITVDSIQAMSPKGEQITKKKKEKSMEDDEMALLARKMSKFLRFSANAVYTGKVSIVLIGQVRMNLGSFIVTEGLSGGRALKHWAVITLHMRRGKKVDAPVEKYKESYTEDGKKKYKTMDRIIGFDCVITLQKTKVSGSQPENTAIHVPFYFESGFSKLISEEDEVKEDKNE